MKMRRTLAAANGRVVSRRRLRERLPRGAEGHAVEMAINRLRDGLGPPGCVTTVIKRGYLLDLG